MHEEWRRSGCRGGIKYLQVVRVGCKQGSDIESSFSAAKEQKWLEEVVSVAAKYSMKSIIYSQIIIVILVILDYEYLSADD